MADRHPVDPLAEIDALLRAELAVAPSHEFLPRVREAVRLEPGPARWPRLLWVLTPMAAAAAILLAVFLRPSGTSETMPPGGTRAADVHLTARPPAAITVGSRDLPRRAEREQRTANTPRPVARSGGQTEVIVDQHQRVALMSMIRMINQGQLSEESFKDTRRPPISIGIEPLAVSPIVVGGVLPSEGERK